MNGTNYLLIVRVNVNVLNDCANASSVNMFR